MALIGLANFHIAKMTAEETATTAPTYETPFYVIGVVSVSIQPEIETAKLYGDNMLLASHTRNKGTTLTVGLARLPLEIRALLFGHEYNNGKMIVGSEDKAPYFAVMFDADTDDGKRMFIKYYKVKFAESQQDIETIGENYDYQTFSIEGTCAERIDTKKEYEAIETTDTSIATTFYGSVI